MWLPHSFILLNETLTYQPTSYQVSYFPHFQYTVTRTVVNHN